MATINRKRFIELVRGSRGRFMGITFVKKNGTEREMNCRLHVSKGVKNKGMSWSPSERGYMTVYDTQKRGHRLVNINTVKSLKVNGDTYTVR